MIYRTCPYCGANLDSGESCDCAGARYERLTPANRVKFDLFVAELMKKQNAAPSAANTEDGRAEQVDHAVSASTID